MTEVSGTNVTSKSLAAPFVCLTLSALRSYASKNSQDRCFPRRKWYMRGCVCALLWREWNWKDHYKTSQCPFLYLTVTRIWNANNFLRTFKRNCLFPEPSNNFVQLETNENLALPPLSMARRSQGSRGWGHLGFTQLSSPHWGLRKAEDESLGYIRWRACLLCANDGAWWRPVFGQHAFSFPHTFAITITACSGKDVVER